MVAQTERSVVDRAAWRERIVPGMVTHRAMQFFEGIELRHFMRPEGVFYTKLAKVDISRLKDSRGVLITAIATINGMQVARFVNDVPYYGTRSEEHSLFGEDESGKKIGVTASRKSDDLDDIGIAFLKDGKEVDSTEEKHRIGFRLGIYASPEIS